MRQTNETATSFKELAEITQGIQAYQTPTQANQNANTSELTQTRALKPKPKEKAKKGALKPTKRAFSDRETTLKGKSQASANKSLKNQQAKENNQIKGGNHEA
ncbi:hypothetical protein I6663_01190 [Helicobacter pylori]|uniref:hypothetical protein n=1 Tax=Helicobacter pylori TaxID=210 RepID=UPI00165CDB99|nr:hypothetical protein [Helicobacter pylori]MBH0260810.1 hypothetical protein [Helicobacter pylori]MBH0261223.1 hypothetical protein [Helicobacter pylori]